MRMSRANEQQSESSDSGPLNDRHQSPNEGAPGTCSPGAAPSQDYYLYCGYGWAWRLLAGVQLRSISYVFSAQTGDRCQAGQASTPSTAPRN
jgi:hypothetical protein